MRWRTAREAASPPSGSPLESLGEVCRGPSSSCRLLAVGRLLQALQPAFDGVDRFIGRRGAGGQADHGHASEPRGLQLADMLDVCLILPYPNESEWFFPHPLLLKVKLAKPSG